MSERWRFRLVDLNESGGLESDACLAIFSAECVYGRPRTRIEVSYLADADGSGCVFAVGGPAGEMALQVFIGLCGERFGETGFNVVPVSRSDAS